MYSAWQQWGCSIILLAIAFSLQGCGLHSDSQHALSLVAVNNRIIVTPTSQKVAANMVRPAEMQDDKDDEDAEVIDVPSIEAHHRSKRTPGFSLLSTGSSETDTSASGTADYDAIARGSDHVRKSGLDKALQMDLQQQTELQDDYANMLYLKDPDDVEKASQLAWMKMEYEDRKLARAMLKDDPQHPGHHRSGVSQIQIGHKTRPRMLNVRARPSGDSQKMITRPVAQVAAAAPPNKAVDAVDDADIADF